jgi:hypothetical protein
MIPSSADMHTSAVHQSQLNCRRPPEKSFCSSWKFLWDVAVQIIHLAAADQYRRCPGRASVNLLTCLYPFRSERHQRENRRGRENRKPLVVPRRVEKQRYSLSSSLRGKRRA